MAVVLTFLFFGVNVNAQSNTFITSSVELPNGGKGIWSLPQGHFVTADEAIQLLLQSNDQLKVQYYSQPANSNLQILLENQIRYNLEIVTYLQKGFKTNVSIVLALDSFQSDQEKIQQQLVSLKQSAVNLLSN
jgi:hypothetical protein